MELKAILFSTRGMRPKLKEIEKITKDTQELELYKKCIRPKYHYLKELVTEQANTAIMCLRIRGFGGVAVIISPLILYPLVTSVEANTCQ